MLNADQKINAYLVNGQNKIPVEVETNSRYSLLVHFLNGNKIVDGKEFPKLIMQINGDTIKLGPCKLNFIKGNNGKSACLYFIKDVFDFQSLFHEHKMVKLQSAFINVPFLLAHKDQIKQPFKDYISSLTYDLNVYKSLFDDIDKEIAQEPQEIKDQVQKVILETEGRKFMHFLDERLEEGENVVSNLSKDEHERHGFYLRKQLWNIIICSPFMFRTNAKPRGYAGDSEMMRMIYENNYMGTTTFAKIMHKHPIEHPAAQAVRTRRRLIAQMVNDNNSCASESQNGKLKVLSVACGPAYEIYDIIMTIEDCHKYHFTLLDQDNVALSEAAELISQVENKFKTKLSVDYLNDSVRTMLATPQIANKWGEYNYIYSMGLFDYLTPPAARAVLAKLLQLLKPGGEMVIGNFHVSNPSRYYMEYWLDWVLYYRSEEDFMDLIPDMNSIDASVFFENTGSQMFLHVKKHL